MSELDANLKLNQKVAKNIWHIYFSPRIGFDCQKGLSFHRKT